MSCSNRLYTSLIGLASMLFIPVASAAAISSQVVCLNRATGGMVVKSKCTARERALNLNLLISSAAVTGPAGRQGPQGPPGAPGDVAAVVGPKTASDVVTIDSLNAGSKLCQGNGYSEGKFVAYTVPSNKTLIVTEVTVLGANPEFYSGLGEQLDGAMKWKITGQLFKTFNGWQYSSNIGVAFAPGSSVIVSCHDNGSGHSTYAWHLTGYLAD